MQAIRASASLNPEQDEIIPGGGPRWLVWGIAILVLIGIGVGGYFYFRQTRPTRANFTTVPAVKGSILGTVNSTGQIAPWTQAKLAFELAGRISSVPVKVGDSVKAGDTLASLDTTQLAIAIRLQEASLASAKAKLAAIQAGPRNEDVMASQAVVDAAQAKLDAMTAQGRAEDVQSAKAALAAAKARLHEMRLGPQSGDVAVAKTAVQLAQANLTASQSDLARVTRPQDPTAIQQAQAALAQAKSFVWQRQTQRDGACGDPLNARYLCDAADSAIGQAQSAQEQAQAKLDQLNQPPHAEDVAAATAAVAAAQAGLASAQAKLDQLNAGSLPDDIAQASANVAQAEQALAVKENPWRPQDIEQQQQAVNQAAAQLALKKQPWTPADVAQAQAAVDVAAAQLDQIKYSLAAATLVAPFGGIVSAVNANVGELASPASGIPVVSLVDPTRLRLDASVDETDVSHVQIGQDVTVAFDAIPGKTFPGKVLGISPNATVQSGVATYIVSISIENSPEIKPGMTGNADIIYAHHDDVLLVPNRAVRTDGDNRVVAVLEGGQSVNRTVTVGVSDDRSTEIVAGIQPGDQVVLPSTSTVAPAFANGGVRR
jgi:HlyD family secretion protein